MEVLAAVAVIFGAFFLIAMLIGFASLAFTLWMLSLTACSATSRTSCYGQS